MRLDFRSIAFGLLTGCAACSELAYWPWAPTRSLRPGRGTKTCPNTNTSTGRSPSVSWLALPSTASTRCSGARATPASGCESTPAGVRSTWCWLANVRANIGRHWNISPDKARRDAVEPLARIKAGQRIVEPELQPKPNLAALAERQQLECVAMDCKPNTVGHYGFILRKHIVQRRDQNLASKVKRKDIPKFDLSDMPTMVNQCVDIVVNMFDMADHWQMRRPRRNPCKSVRRYKVDLHKERFPTPEELARLGCTLDIGHPKRLAFRHSAAATRLLVLTGCQRNEKLTLRERTWTSTRASSGLCGANWTGARVWLPCLPSRTAGGWSARA